VADKQRISYPPPDQLDPDIRAELDRCHREGTPRPESSAVRAHLPSIEHHQVLPGTSASLAPGFETAEAMAETKPSQDYRANP
jgi:hypothetical protein